MRTIEQAGDLRGKRVFLRADLDVPVKQSSVSSGQFSVEEPFRIQKQKECVHYLLERGARVVIGAHISAVPSFEPLKPELEKILGVRFGDEVALLENLRSDPGEEADDETYAQKLAEGCELYVNNAFAVCHRKHASVDALARLVPSYAGPLVAEEVRRLSEAMRAPAEGKVVFMGGAKVSTKMPVIENFLNKADVIAVGGKLANELGVPSDPRIRVPTDFIGEEKLDIGPVTAATFAALARSAKLVIWNGPMGKFEDPRFMAGTKALAEAIAASPALSVIGGGDTIAAINACGISLDRFGFVSTGGGAMLAFLAGEKLPGLEVLGYHADIH